MRISDWSSDVCSSDLHLRDLLLRFGDKGARITAFQVHLHDDAPLAILAADLVQAFGETDLRDLGERNLPPQTAFLRKQDRNHADVVEVDARSEEHTSELQSLMRISYAVFCLKTNTRS